MIEPAALVVPVAALAVLTVVALVAVLEVALGPVAAGQVPAVGPERPVESDQADHCNIAVVVASAATDPFAVV